MASWLCENKAYKSELQEQAMLLLRVLPGQRDAAVLWSDFFNDELKEENEFERNLACLPNFIAECQEVFWSFMLTALNLVKLVVKMTERCQESWR